MSENVRKTEEKLEKITHREKIARKFYYITHTLGKNASLLHFSLLRC